MLAQGQLGGPMGTGVKVLFLTVSLLLAGAAQGQPVNGQRFGDWKIGCEQENQDADPVCYLYWSSAPGADPMLHLAVAKAPEAPNPSLRVEVPLGVRLRSAVAIHAGEASWPIEVRYCLEQGCHGIIELDGPLTETLKGSSALEVTFAYDIGSPVTVTVPTAGFAEGLETLLWTPDPAAPTQGAGTAAER